MLLLVAVVHQRHQVDLGMGRQLSQDVQRPDAVASIRSVWQAMSEEKDSQ